jgi:flavodoxin
MKNILYYFTGTGNSLAIARKLADLLGNYEVVPGDIKIKPFSQNNLAHFSSFAKLVTTRIHQVHASMMNQGGSDGTCSVPQSIQKSSP